MSLKNVFKVEYDTNYFKISHPGTMNGTFSYSNRLDVECRM